MPKDAREVTNALLKKGFRQQQGADAYFHLFVAGKKTPVFTKASHGEREIGDKLLGMMSRQLKLTRRQFGDLIDCPLSETDYVGLLRDGGHIG